MLKYWPTVPRDTITLDETIVAAEETIARVIQITHGIEIILITKVTTVTDIKDDIKTETTTVIKRRTIITAELLEYWCTLQGLFRFGWFLVYKESEHNPVRRDVDLGMDQR